MKILKRKKKKRTIKNRFVLTVVSSPVEIFLPLHLNLISDYNIYIYVSLFFFFLNSVVHSSELDAGFVGIGSDSYINWICWLLATKDSLYFFIGKLSSLLLQIFQSFLSDK